jgi:Bacterial protein of unknown function (DUF885)
MSKFLMVMAVAGLGAGSIQAAEMDWVEKSNQYSKVVLAAMAKLSPESAGSMGVDGLDEEITDLGPGVYERGQKIIGGVVAELEKDLATEADVKVRQDLGILIKAGQDTLHSQQLQHENLLPYFNMNQTIFSGIRALIDPQIPPDRYPAAVVRLQKYAGLVDGYEPITKLAEARSKERFGVHGLTGPYRGEVEQDLERAETFINGIKDLLAGTDLEGWQDAYETLASEMRDYNDWVRAEILPLARDDFRQPPVLYEDALKNWGVDAAPRELIEQGTRGYMDIRDEMQSLAPLVAKQKGYDTSDYREVIARLKKDGAIDGDKLVDSYRSVLGRIEQILVREKLISLPQREAGIRIATAAETAAQPAAHLELPRLIGNTGEYPYFVIPLIERNDDGSWQQSDDTYEAGTWTLTAHEARPGHEMQFSSIIESGVSIARAIFAFNSANVEGWGLYAEAMVKPYMPLDAQLVSLQARLLRAARMFLDPMLNLGEITPEQAKRLLVENVGVGEDWAQNEIERYTYRIPGQATAYYYGYGKLQALRGEVEVKLQDKFDPRAFHDFILEQGLLPPQILKQAVMEEFVPSQLD